MSYLITDGVHYIRGSSLDAKPGYRLQVADIDDVTAGGSTMCEVLEMMTNFDGSTVITVDKLTNMDKFKLEVLKAAGGDAIQISRRVISVWTEREDEESDTIDIAFR